MPERLRGFTTRRYIDQRYLYHYLYLLFDFASYHSCWLASNTTRLVQNLYSLPGEVLFVVACFCNFVTLFVSIITAKQLWNHVVNPLEYRGNCNAASSKMKSVHWTPMGGLLHFVRRGEDWAGWQSAQSSPRCTKCNSPPINGQCVNHNDNECFSYRLRRPSSVFTARRVRLARTMPWQAVCPSVCPSDTRRYSV